MIGYSWCADCERTVELTQHAACLYCGSGSTAPRNPVRRVEYVPDERSRLSLSVETTADGLEGM
jgi:hypothetical protein